MESGRFLKTWVVGRVRETGRCRGFVERFSHCRRRVHTREVEIRVHMFSSRGRRRCVALSVSKSTARISRITLTQRATFQLFNSRASEHEIFLARMRFSQTRDAHTFSKEGVMYSVCLVLSTCERRGVHWAQGCP